MAVEGATPLVLLLLLPGILPLIFFVHHRLVNVSTSHSSALTACICLSVLAVLAVLSASFGIAALYVAQHILQSIVELGYRVAIVYLLTPSCQLLHASRISISSAHLRRHNILFLFIIFIAFLLSLLHLSLPAVPNSLPCAFGLVASLFPVPLLLHLALSSPSQQLRKIWSFVVILQLLSALAAILRIPSPLTYSLPRALSTVLWATALFVLFYALLAVPLTPLVPPPAPLATTPTRVVHYHSRTLSLNHGLITSEDFTALRDPFASPPPVSPISPLSPAAFSRPHRPSTPTPVHKQLPLDNFTDEVLLSQVLLHSLTRDACGP